MNKTHSKLWVRAKRAGFFLQSTPFLRMIGVNGSLALGRATDKSDIDFLIVAEKNRIWTCRFFIALILTLLNYRRTNEKIARRVCLNRFITTGSLLIYPFDQYHASVYSQTIPILDKGIYKKFIDNNSWMRNFIELKYMKTKNIKTNRFLRNLSVFIEFLLKGKTGNLIEKILKNYQLRKIKSNPHTLAKQGLIIANDSMLCFHPTSRLNLTKLG